MTNRELISRVKHTLKENRADSILTNKHIYNVLYTNASFFIKRDADAKKNIYKLSNIWTSICIEMEQVSAILCECISLPVNCTVWRSKEKLPEFLETSSGFLYKSITSIDGSVDADLVTPYTYRTKSKIKYNKDIYAFIEDGYLYMPGKGFPYMKVVGYFKNPTKSTCSTSTTTDTKCSILDKEFPCPDYLIQPCIEQTIRELSTFKQLPYDHIQNKNENPQVI